MEKRMMSTRPFGEEVIHPFRMDENSVNNYDAPISIRNSPPLTYENTRQHANGVDRSFTHDLPPSRHPGSLGLSDALNIPKLPSSGRSRPLPIPAQPKMSPADGRPVVLSLSAVPPISTHLQQPPAMLNNQRRRPLPQPGVTTAPPTLPPSTHLSSSQTSSLLSSSYTSHSRSGSSTSNAVNLRTTASYSCPHSSPSYQTSFASTSRASTLPVSKMQTPTTRDGFALLRRAETQPSSAPPYQSAFNTVAAIGSRNLQGPHAFKALNADAGRAVSVGDGKAKSILLGTGNETAAQRESSVKICTNQMDPAPFVLEGGTVLPTSGITTATPEIPSLPPLDFAMPMSPIAPFVGLKSDSSASGSMEGRTVVDKVTDVDNELGLSGMNKEEKQVPNAAHASLPPVFQLPPPPTVSSPLPRARKTIPTQQTNAVSPSVPVSLRPLNGGSNLTGKNRPVLSIRTWDLDSKAKAKKEQRRTASLLPSYRNQSELKVPSTAGQVQARNSVHPSGTVPRRMQGSPNRASFLPSMGSAPKQTGSSYATPSALMVPVWGDTAVSGNSMLLGPEVPTHLEDPPSKSSGLATQLKKMGRLHRKSKSITEWTWNETLNVTNGSLHEHPEAADSAVSNAPMSQSRSLFGFRHPYGFQRGAATCSLTSVGASMPTASGSSLGQSTAPRPDVLYPTAPTHAPLSFIPSHQPKRSPPFRMAPLPPAPIPVEPKGIGALWTKLRFGTARKTMNNVSRKKNINLW